jgi:hypothetical protein
MVLGGDGRWFNKQAAQIIIKLAAGNGVTKMYVGRDGFLCTPAASAVIRARKAAGGFIMSASHNPGGPENDWGIKFNSAGGEPAPEKLTDAIYGFTQSVSSLRFADIPDVDLSKLGVTRFGAFEVEVIDPVADYLALFKARARHATHTRDATRAGAGRDVDTCARPQGWLCAPPQNMDARARARLRRRHRAAAPSARRLGAATPRRSAATALRAARSRAAQRLLVPRFFLSSCAHARAADDASLLPAAPRAFAPRLLSLSRAAGPRVRLPAPEGVPVALRLQDPL